MRLRALTYYSGLSILTPPESHCGSQISQILGEGLEFFIGVLAERERKRRADVDDCHGYLTAWNLRFDAEEKLDIDV